MGDKLTVKAVGYNNREFIITISADNLDAITLTAFNVKDKDNLMRLFERIEKRCKGLTDQIDELNKKNKLLEKRQIPEGWICHP